MAEMLPLTVRFYDVPGKGNAAVCSGPAVTSVWPLTAGSSASVARQPHLGQWWHCHADFAGRTVTREPKLA